MAQLSEENIIDAVYALYEGDTTGWDTTSEEYLTARAYCNAAINLWETYDNTNWRELWGTLTAASDGDKTTVAADYSYDCPTNMKKPSSWVRIGGTFYNVISPEKLASYANSDELFVYFTGSEKTGFDLNINPRLTVTAGQTIEYEYYKGATKFTTTTDTTEVPDPYFIVYFVLARLLKNDGEDYGEERDLYESKLDDMQTANISGYIGIPDPMEDIEGGFGE